MRFVLDLGSGADVSEQPTQSSPTEGGDDAVRRRLAT